MKRLTRIGMVLTILSIASFALSGATMVTEENILGNTEVNSPQSQMDQNLGPFYYCTSFKIGDGSGISEPCPQIDEIPPEIECPANIVLNNDPGECGAVVSYIRPEATDNCPGVITELYTGLGPGALFPVGLTIESYRAEDASGNEAFCSFNITVMDTEIPQMVSATSESYTEQALIFAPDAVDNDQFGNTVDISGNYLLSAAPFKNENRGVVYVYERSGIDWNYVTDLTASDGDPGDQFGRSVAFDNDRAAVGAIFENSFGERAGAVYIFEGNLNGWNQIQKITAPDIMPGDAFGFSVDMEGDRLVIGAYGQDQACTDCGAIYVYSWNGSLYELDKKITAGDASTSDLFGYGVAVSGDRIAALTYKKFNPYDPSSVYIFESVGSDWIQTAKFSNVDVADSKFGFAMDFSGNNLVVTAPLDNQMGYGAGAVYVFNPLGGDWVQTAKLIASDGFHGDYLGVSVAVHNNTIVAGAYLADINGYNMNEGAAYMYKYNGSEWQQVQKIIASEPNEYDEFGLSVAIGDGSILIGAPYLGYTKQGAVYSFIPSICPDDITVSNDPGECGAIVNYQYPELSDNCPGTGMMVTPGMESGSFFEVGEHNVTITATDGAGFSSSCDFMIRVRDTEAPEIACPDILVIGEDPEEPTVTATLYAPDAIDNCGIEGTAFNSFNLSHEISLEVPVGGEEYVTWLVLDVNGNQGSCSQKISAEGSFVCNPPQNLTAAPISSTKVYLDWSDVNGAMAFKVEGRIHGMEDFTSTVTTHSWKKLGGLLSGTLYEWRVMTYCENGDISEYTDIHTFILPTAKSSEGMILSNLFPNPADQAVNINLQSNTEKLSEITITNSLGEVIYVNRLNPGQNNLSIETNQWSSGIYFIMINVEGEGKVVDKLIVQH
jgi:hypothetical protein